MGFTDFDPPADPLHGRPAAGIVAEPPRPARRDEFYHVPIVDGRPVPNTLFTSVRDQLRALLMSSGEREEARLESSRQQLSQRVAVPADLQLKTMLDSGTFSLAGLARSTRVPIKRLGLAVASQLA